MEAQSIPTRDVEHVERRVDPLGERRRASREHRTACELLARVVERDHDALAALYDTFGPRVHGWALRVLHDPTAAADATCSTFREVWRRAEALEQTPSDVGAWILGLAHQHAVDLQSSWTTGPTALERDSIDLARGSGLTYVEVAQRLDVDPDAVVTAMRTGLVRLQHGWGSQGSASDPKGA